MEKTKGDLTKKQQTPARKKTKLGNSPKNVGELVKRIQETTFRPYKRKIVKITLLGVHEVCIPVFRLNNESFRKSRGILDSRTVNFGN